MLGKETDDSLDSLKEKVEKMNKDWILLDELARKHEEKLKISYDVAKKFSDEIYEFLDYLPKIEARLRTKVCFVVYFIFFLSSKLVSA